MCNVLHATRFLNDVEKWREEFIKITAGAADSNGEWRYSEEDHQKSMLDLAQISIFNSNSYFILFIFRHG